MHASLKQAMADVTLRVDEHLKLLLPKCLDESPLCRAMHYALFNGGKRLRPFIVLSIAEIFDADDENAERVAAAIECIHAYSLIHDDLPMLDNSDMRRGNLSCHKQFDEATALLAGDALQTLAFEIINHPETNLDPRLKSDLTYQLAYAAGGSGMVEGQMLDIIFNHKVIDEHLVTRIQHLKTGALIRFCAHAGASIGGAKTSSYNALISFAQDLGLLFQMTDDVLDAIGETSDTGKSIGRDAALGKTNFVTLLGIEQAKARIAFLSDQAHRHLDLFGERANLLHDLIDFVKTRQH